MERGHIPDAEKHRLAGAWHRASYEADVAGTRWPLRIGSLAPALERAWPARSYLLITAWNPPDESPDDAENHAANRRLREAIDAVGLRRIPARAHDGQGGWQEPGWLVADAALPQADAWMRTFRQGGVLFWEAGTPVGLRLRWRRPDDVPSFAHVIWSGQENAESSVPEDGNPPTS